MRIAYVHSGSDLYGASRSLLRLSSRLVKDGHSLLVILPSEGPLCAALRDCGVDLVVQTDLPLATRSTFASPSKLLKLAVSAPLSTARLYRCLRRFKPDLVHSNTATLLTPGLVAKALRVPHVWHIREFFVEFPGMWPAFQRFMAAFSEVIICVSTAVQEQFSPKIRARKTLVIHNGFPIGEFPEVSPERVTLFRKRYSLNGNPTVGVVGRIKLGRKGQDLFLRAAAQVVAQHKDVRFLCIGSPFPGNEDHLQKLLKLSEELGIADKVICTGDVEDVQAAYTALDISVLSSAQPEPFGGVVIESMALSRPVVGTRLGGTIEQVEDKVTGILVDPDNPEEMAMAIDRLLSDSKLREQMGRSGRERFLRVFEFEPFYDRILQLYSHLVRGYAQ